MKILVVDDDRIVAQSLQLLLRHYNYAVDIAVDGEAALQMADAFDYHLVLLDVLLPRLNGIEVCQQLRKQGFRQPILLLTGQGETQQKAIALNAGADDYVVKPFDNDELVARIQALFRRGATVGDPILSWNHLSLDPNTRRVVYQDRLLVLTPKEYAIIELFLRSQETVFSARVILDRAWSSLESPGEEVVRYHIKDLRQKLMAVGAPKNTIETVYRVGYRLNPLYASSTPIQVDRIPSHPQVDELRSVNDRLQTVLEQLRSTQAALQQKNQELEIADRTIEQQRQQLQATRDELEQRVTERTAALSESEERFRRAIDAASPWIGTNGQFNGYIGSVIDVGDRKLAEARLSESEEKYRALFNDMSEGFCTVEVLYDEDGQPIDHRFLQANPAFERHTNLSSASGSLASELMPGLERVWNDLYARIIATGKSERIEQYSPAFDRWFEVEAARVGDASLCRVAVVFRDITDRKRAEEILRRTAELDAFRVALADALRPLTDASDILAIAARTLGESLRATRVIYFEVVSNGEEAIIHRNYTNGVAEMSGRYRFEDYRRNLTADHQAGKTQIVTNIPDNPKYNDAEKANYRELAIAAHIDVPLVKNNQFVAMLAVHQSTPRQWTETEIKRVEETAERTWAAIERARAEAALRQNEEQTRNILESIHEAFFALDENWQFTYLNPSVEALLDRTLDDLVGKNLWEEYPGLIGSEFEPIYLGAMHDRVAGSLTQFYPDHDRWYEVRTYPAPNGISVYFRNVTEQIAATAVLRESEERYRTLFESIDEGFCTVEMLFDENDTPIDYRFLEVNPRFERQTGLRQVVGKRILEMVPEYEQYWFEIYGRIAMTGEPLRFENQARALNRWYDVYAYRSGQPEQHRVGILFRDISDRKQAEQKIQEQAALLDITSDAIFVRDLDHRILYWNQGAKQIYGWLATEAIGKTAYHLLQSNPDLIPEIMPMLLAQGEWQGELHKTTKTGKTVIVEARWTLMRDAADRPQFILSVDTDITEKKQLEAQFYRAQRLESVGTLASGIAHDLNNVLTPILAISQLLRLPQFGLAERSQEMLQIVEDSAKRGANMVRQILTFTRGSEGERTSVEVAPLLQEVIKVVKQTFPKSIKVRKAIPEKFLSQVSADATQLHQLLMNLCVNARDAMPDGGTLTLAVENFEVNEIFAQMNLDARVGQYVLIAVSDTGTGIAPEVRDRIFDPFFTTKASGQGTGLGLSTVLGIVRSDGGFVQVASEVGKGTQFKVYLPAIETQASRKLQEAKLPQGQGKLILVVDDEESILQATGIILETHHYRVLTANSGTNAIATYAQHQQQIAVVLVDMMMPDMDGVTLIRILQKMNPEIRAIATSGVMPQYQQNLKALGITTCINKPYTTEELLNKIQLQGISIN